MAKHKQILLDFEVDKLTNSIENILSGDNFSTDISIVNKRDVKNITKKAGWLFDWAAEASLPDRDVYKLPIVNNTIIIRAWLA